MSDKQEQIDTILDQWDALRAEGHFVTPEEVCADKPNLLTDVRKYIAAVEWVNRKGESFFESSQPNHKRTLGRYALKEIVGAGGHGTVWKAYDTELERDVAIKLPQQNFTNDNQRSAFVFEARSLAKLEHPNIVKVYDISQDGDDIFIVSQLIEGSSLRGLMATDAVDHQKAIGIIQQIARALGYAHDNGIIHRDVKPANILIDQSEKAFLADFGIAVSKGDETSTDTRGTLSYQSPEQSLLGDEVDHRSDIFSLGVVAYELLTSQLPFRAGEQGKFNRPTFATPSELDASIPLSTSKAIVRALSAVPSDRFDNAVQFADALGPRPNLQRFLLGAVATAATLLIGLIIYAVVRIEPTSHPLQQMNQPLSRFTFDNSGDHFENTGMATELELRVRGNTQFVAPPTEMQTPLDSGSIAELSLGKGKLPDSKADGNGFTFAKHEISSGTGFAISFWFRRSSVTKTDTLIHLGQEYGFGKSSTPQLTIWLDENDRLRILSFHRFINVRPGNAQLNENIDIGDNIGKWRHLLVSFDTTPSPAIAGKGVFRVYVDGALSCENEGVKLGVVLRNSKSRLCVGAPLKPFNNDDGANFVGFIDDIELWNRAIKPADQRTKRR